MLNDVLKIEYKDILEFLDSDKSDDEKLKYLFDLKRIFDRLINSLSHSNIEDLPLPNKELSFYKNNPGLFEILSAEFGINFENHDHTYESIQKVFEQKRNHITDLLSKINLELESYSKIPQMERNSKKENQIRTDIKIKWLGTEAQLSYLFDLLVNNNLLEPTLYAERFSVISKHFVNKNGDNFNQKQLSQSVRNLKNGLPKNANTINSIIDEINKIKE